MTEEVKMSRDALNAQLNAMEEVFRHLYGDEAVDNAVAAVLADAEKGVELPWNAVSLKLKASRGKAN